MKIKKTGTLIFSVLTAASLFLSACGNNNIPEAGTEAVQTTEAAESKASEADASASKKETSAEAKAEEMTYESKLFDTSYVHTIDVTISEDDWADLLKNPTDKTKYEVSVNIDGENIESVSFATKGNTSLSSVADSDSDRYSFKVNFGKYVDDQTYYGLDKLNLNNVFADATYMKDYLSYTIFREAGAEAPLTSYVWLTINGEDYGLYLAVEDVSDSYLERNHDGEGELYKPETEQLDNVGKAGGKKGGKKGEKTEDSTGGKSSEFPGGMPKGGKPDLNNTDSKDGRPEGGKPGRGGDNGDRPELPEGMSMDDIPKMPEGFGGGFGETAKGADLAYSDDEITSYSDIFDNAETKVDEEDEQRVIAALKALSENKNLDEYLYTDEIIRYFAAHNFVLNYDSYTGNMLHNYYLYENDGKLSMIPWDYNSSFGTFGGMGMGDPDKEESRDATSLINIGIDTPLSGTTADSRPMWNWIVSNDEYLEQYHSAFKTLISEYFESGRFEEETDALYEMLLPYVEKDPTAFYTADEFTQAYKTLKETCLLRAESIRLQLDGKLSTNSDEQSSEERVDASGINIKDMGDQSSLMNNDKKH